MQCSWGKFQGTKHLVQDREIFKIEGSQDIESPLYHLMEYIARKNRLVLNIMVVPREQFVWILLYFFVWHYKGS